MANETETMHVKQATYVKQATCVSIHAAEILMIHVKLHIAHVHQL